MAAPSTGRRERKRAQTRRALADAAKHLFLERGFDAVTVTEVAEAADVSVSTLFQHFESKEALIFERDDGVEAAWVATVAERTPGTSVLHALRDGLVEGIGAGPTPEIRELVERTPALSLHLARMWTRYVQALAPAVAEATGLDIGDVRVEAFSRYVVLVPSITRSCEDRAAAVRELFDLLEMGWGDF